MSETASAPQADALTGQTDFYSFSPPQRREKASFHRCTYMHQLQMKLSLTASICGAKTVTPTGLVDYLMMGVFLNLLNSVLHSKAQTWRHGAI